MKQDSKIALGAFAVGLAAFLWARKHTKGASGIGSTKKYYVYAGYYENYISSEPMPDPYILRRTFRSIDRAIDYADSFGDEVIYCENVKYDLPDYLYEALQDEDYEYFTVDGVSGIGATKKAKRRIWREIELAQQANVDLEDPNGWERSKNILSNLIYNLRVPIDRTSTSGKPVEQRYFNQLRRAYKSVAGTNLPYDESVVRNENDDVILIYRDYHMDQLPKTAAKYVLSDFINGRITDGYSIGYWATIGSIANGQKFVWASKGEHRGIETLIFGQKAPSERKLRISYLASPDRGGMYPEAFAHYVWESITDGRGDDQDITNGVLDALRECTSVGQAQKMCVDEYLKAHQVQEPLLYQDVPF